MAAVAAGPMALWAADLQPPWPPGSSVVATTACAVAVWLVFGLQSILRRTVVLKSLGVGAFIAGLVLGGWYFDAYARSIEWIDQPADGSTRRMGVVIGDELQPGVSLDNKNTHDALLDNELRANRIWTDRSIRRAQLTLLVTFVASFFCLTFGSTVVTLHARRKPVPRPAA